MNQHELPGFGSLFELGLSDVLRTFIQGIGRTDGWGYALRTDGTVWKWENRQVLVGNIYEPVRYVTKQLAFQDRVSQLAGNFIDGSSPRFALQADGTVWGWGEDLYEELALSATDFDAPVQQLGLASVRSLLATSDGAARFALTHAGEVWGWGSNYFGHLCDGTTTDRLEPERISGLEGIRAVAVTSTGRCLALQSTGEVWTWGNTFGGEASNDLLRPTRLAGLPPVTSVFEDAATAEDGSFWIWDDRLTPSRIPGLSDVDTFVKATGSRQPTYHVLKCDGTVWGWGGNENGQVGDGTTVERAEPVIVNALSDVADIVGRGAARYALTHSGEVFGWGGVGYDDPLGVTPRLIPVPPANAARTFEKWMSIQPAPVGVSTLSPAAIFNLSRGKTYLMHWVAVGDVEQVQAILQQGADVNAVDDDGDPALYYALSNARPEIVNLLLVHGADPNITGRSGNPLQVAADKGWIGVVCSLVVHHADVNRRGAGGLTAAMLAAGSGWTEVLRVLHAAGADLDLLDDDGDSALFYAASRGQVEAVRLLLQQGANPSPRPGSSGHTPLSIATILSTSNHPLPPGTTRSGLAAVAHLLTSRPPAPGRVDSQTRAPRPANPPSTAPLQVRPITRPRTGTGGSQWSVPDVGLNPVIPGLGAPSKPGSGPASQWTSSGGCFVATAVYGSYDCPQVRVLRRWRDSALISTRRGRALVRIYYALSPRLIGVVGDKAWFVAMAKRPLDRVVAWLMHSGISNGPYPALHEDAGQAGHGSE